MLEHRERRIHKLRISVTDHCQFRCVYCMPKTPHFSSPAHFISFDEITAIVQRLQVHGIDTVRLTGGEPLMRAQVPELVRKLKAIGIASVGLSTNGHLLTPALAAEFKAAGLDAWNISLDTLDPEVCQKMNKVKVLDKVLEAIDIAVASGIPVKTNTVVMRGFNEQELPAILDYAHIRGVEPRFLELLRIGPMVKDHARYFVSADEMRSTLAQSQGELRALPYEAGSTARYYLTSTARRFGIIASETQAFCATCTRMRLTATGKLLGCLFVSEGEMLMPHLDDEKRMAAAWERTLAQKPWERIAHSPQEMYAVGG